MHLIHGGGASDVTVSNLGAAGDGVMLQTNGGTISMQGGDVHASNGLRADGDLDVRHADVRGNLATGGTGTFGGAVAAAGRAIAGQSLSVHGAATVTAKAGAGEAKQVIGSVRVAAAMA